MNLNDTISVEIDRRKIRRIIEQGLVTPEELAGAKIYLIRQVCSCPNSRPSAKNKCVGCGTPYEEKR